MTKILYLAYDYQSYYSKVFLKNIDYNILYAYNVYLPTSFTFNTYMTNLSTTYSYRYAIDLKDEYLSIVHDLSNLPTNTQTQSLYEVFRF